MTLTPMFLRVVKSNQGTLNKPVTLCFGIHGKRDFFDTFEKLAHLFQCSELGAVH